MRHTLTLLSNRPATRLLLLGIVLTASCADSTSPPGGGGGPGPIDTLPGPVDTIPLGETFATYFGGGDDDIVRDLAVDAQGNVYMAGSTRSPNYPTTAGAFDGSFNQGSFPSDAFVTKLSPSGQILWSTFLGGPNYERVYGLEVDELGYVYVAGRAGPGFPVTSGALQTTFGGDIRPEAGYGLQDGFVCKLAPDGGSVVFCTYFGNTDHVPIRDIAIDANHDIYIVSSLEVGTLPSSWFTNAFQKTIRGNRDGLVVKIKGDGSAVLWATFLGGSGLEGNTNSIQVDASGVYVNMFTHSSDLQTPNGFDHTLSGPTDIYAAKLSLDGSQLLYGTYVGGSGSEDTETHQLAVDAQGNAFVAVPTTSTDFPTTANAYQRFWRGGQSDALVVKISPSGQLAAATYVGGSGADGAEGIAVDGGGNVAFSGATDSPNFPKTGGPLGGIAGDMYAVLLSSDLSTLRFANRLGGSGNDRGRAAAARGSVFVVGGQTNSTNWPVLSAVQPSFSGVLDGTVVRYEGSP